MHPALQTILMIRDKDLLRWGRLGSIAMLISGLACVVAGFVIRWLVDHRLEPALERSTELLRLYESHLSDPQAVASWNEMFDLRAGIDREILDLLRSVPFLMGIGAGIFALYVSVLLWRGYEFALSRSTGNPNPSSSPESPSTL